jgi:hypothetical protein
VPRPMKSDPRQARHRREQALARNELRLPTQPRESAAGVTSFAVKRQDPVDADAISRFLEQRGSTR